MSRKESKRNSKVCSPAGGGIRQAFDRVDETKSRLARKGKTPHFTKGYGFRCLYVRGCLIPAELPSSSPRTVLRSDKYCNIIRSDPARAKPHPESIFIRPHGPRSWKKGLEPSEEHSILSPTEL